MKSLILLSVLLLLLAGCQSVPPTTPPAPVAPSTPSAGAEPTLKVGASGQSVRDLQNLLNGTGLKIMVDGSFGDSTEAAVFSFQTSKGLKADGIVGPATWTALQAAQQPVPPTPSPTPGPTPVAGAACAAKLAWEATSHPERTPWSTYLCQQIDSRFSQFDKATDASRICPNYKNLSRVQRVTAWAQFMVADAKFESSWSPLSRMKEALGTDGVTGLQVESEGLWQLSYGDQKWAPWCQFNWPVDKKLSPTDPKKTILDPYINTACAMGIMGRQIDRTGKVILTSGVYWSTLKDGGKYSKVAQIIDITQELPFCNLSKAIRKAGTFKASKPVKPNHKKETKRPAWT